MAVTLIIGFSFFILNSPFSLPANFTLRAIFAAGMGDCTTEKIFPSQGNSLTSYLKFFFYPQNPPFFATFIQYMYMHSMQQIL
jgi:hypothetical protein